MSSMSETKPSNPKDAVGVRKVGLSSVPTPVLWELGVAMMEGACKYGRHNYRVIGVRASVYYDAFHRHLGAWWEGEDIDPESGLCHASHAAANLMMAHWMIMCTTSDAFSLVLPYHEGHPW